MNYAVEFPVPEKSVDSWDIHVIANVHFSHSVWDLTPLFHNKRQGLDSIRKLNFKTIEEFPEKNLNQHKHLLEAIQFFFYLLKSNNLALFPIEEPGLQIHQNFHQKNNN